MHTSKNVLDDGRLITEARTREIYERIRQYQQGEGALWVNISAWWSGELRWARNRVSLASDRRDLFVMIIRGNRVGTGYMGTNQVDDASLSAAVGIAERKMQRGASVTVPEYDGLQIKTPSLPFPETQIWSEATYNVTAQERASLAQRLTEGAEAQQLLSSGFLQMRVAEGVEYGSDFSSTKYDVSSDATRPEGSGAQRIARDQAYIRYTESQCSMTVRHPKGAGSGWAGLSSYDWSAIDAPVLADRALAKCVASLNPVAIEPGRYTTIFEPQAVSQLVDIIVAALQDRVKAETRDGAAFGLGRDETLRIGRSKLGLKVIDERISIAHDPMDSRLGIIPELGLGPATWIEHGVLKSLGYQRGFEHHQYQDYALGFLNDNLPVTPRSSYAMTGGSTPIEEMIATTKRGVIVTRFSNVSSTPYGDNTLLCTGLTRDGLWLVENGKITKAVKNMRFTDSPLFVLNQVEQLGTPVPVFNPGDTRNWEYGLLGSDRLRPIIVPPLKANDFAFTSMVDAI